MDVLKNIKKQQSDFLIKLVNSKNKLLGLNKFTRLSPKSKKSPGKSPGTLVYVGEDKFEDVNIEILSYNKSDLKEFETKEIKDIKENKNEVTWINLTGIHDIKFIEDLGKKFHLDSLLLEDVVNTNQRPKVEEFGDKLFAVLKMITYNNENNSLKLEQISIVLGKNFVITFQERKNSFFEPIKKRIKEKRKKIRSSESDYLFYAVIDTIIDNYFSVLENIGEQIEIIEIELINNFNNKLINLIYGLKREILLLRKSIWPLREIISNLERNELKLIKKETLNYMRDVYDHTIQIIDTVETFREMLSGMLDLYISISGNKMNEVMKVLTIIATIFIPLTFIAGVYGMNFEHIPELSYKFAYPLFWTITILIGLLMTLYFKKKNWV